MLIIMMDMVNKNSLMCRVYWQISTPRLMTVVLYDVEMSSYISACDLEHSRNISSTVLACLSIVICTISSTRCSEMCSPSARSNLQYSSACSLVHLYFGATSFIATASFCMAI